MHWNTMLKNSQYQALDLFSYSMETPKYLDPKYLSQNI